MLVSVIIFLREVLEASLLISIFLAISYQLGLSRKWIFYGMGIGLLGAIFLRRICQKYHPCLMEQVRNNQRIIFNIYGYFDHPYLHCMLAFIKYIKSRYGSIIWQTLLQLA